MKIVNTPIFNKKIKAAIRKIRRNKLKAPSEGSMYSLSYGYTKKGKWQVEYIRDCRCFKRPYIAAFYFDTKSQEAHLAKSVKYQEL